MAAKVRGMQTFRVKANSNLKLPNTTHHIPVTATNRKYHQKTQPIEIKKA